MTDREAIELIIPETGLSKMAETEYYHGFEGLDAVRKALSDANALAVSALREREERSKGCRYCSIGADMKNDEDMEMDLFNYAEGMDFSVYPNFCPMCGRKLKTAAPLKPPMTNAQKIRSMTDEELSAFLDKVALDDIDYGITFCGMCNGNPKNNILGLDCDGCRLHWLQQPYKEETT